MCPYPTFDLFKLFTDALDSESDQVQVVLVCIQVTMYSSV